MAMLGLIPVLVMAAAGSALADPLGPERQMALRNLLVQDCGSCNVLKQ
jgi:hypothetical protein